jgi:hypothetical protein
MVLLEALKGFKVHLMEVEVLVLKVLKVFKV